MLLSKPMKTKSDEMKGEKEKIRASSKKRGSLGEPIGKGDFDSSAFCTVLSSSSRAAGTSGRRRWGDQRQKWRCLEWYHAKIHDILTKTDIL